MTWITTLPIVERAIPVFLFTLYMITAVRLCRYSSWLQRGAPNPFLPRKLKLALRKREIAQHANGNGHTRTFA